MNLTHRNRNLLCGWPKAPIISLLTHAHWRASTSLPPFPALFLIWRHMIWWLLYWTQGYRYWITYSEGWPSKVSKISKQILFGLYSDFLWPPRDIQLLCTITPFGGICSLMWFAIVLRFKYQKYRRGIASVHTHLLWRRYTVFFVSLSKLCGSRSCCG